MKILETNKDIFTLPEDASINYACCVTTNGIVKMNGCAVMGAGVALRANQLYKCDKTLGVLLQSNGNHCFRLGEVRNPENGVLFQLFSFPTKNHFKYHSSINLIIQSCGELMELCDKYDINRAYLTPPGCGNGGLDWDVEVEPVISKYLDDRVTIVLRQ